MTSVEILILPGSLKSTLSSFSAKIDFLYSLYSSPLSKYFLFLRLNFPNHRIRIRINYSKRTSTSSRELECLLLIFLEGN